MLPGQSHMIHITVIVQSVGTLCWATKGSFIQQGCLASATLAGAGAGPRPAWANISCRCWRQGQKTARECAGRRGAGRPAQTAYASCLCRPCPSPHPGPSCSQHSRSRPLPWSNDPHAAVHTAPFEALTAPGYLLQGKIKIQTWVNHWKFEWMNLRPCCCNLFLSACSTVGNIWKSRALPAWFMMIGHRSWQFDSQKRRKYWRHEESIVNTDLNST